MFIKRILRFLKRKRVFYLVNKKYAGARPEFFEKKRKALNSIGCDIGEGTKIVGPILIQCKLKIGKNCWINRNFECQGNGEVEIGDNCDFGPDVIINTGGHKIGDSSRRAGEGIITKINVESGTWVGLRSTIINNTTIGKSCVIAAGSVVIKDVPDNVLVAGVPAQIKRELGDE